MFGRRTLLLACSLILGTACSQRSESNSQATAGGNAAAPKAAPAAAPDFRELAACAAKMEAVGRLYRAIASQSSGEQAAQMNSRASQRGRAGFELRIKAEQSERAADASSGPGKSQVPTIIRETEATLEAERSRQPFEDFAIWLGREADRCAPLVPAGT
jgi:hypothetical protein